MFTLTVLRARQIEQDPDDPEMLIVRSFYVSKRKKDKDHPTPDIPLPMVGSQAPFTKHVLEYLELLDQDDRLFKFSRARGCAIIRHMTGQWPHWFRAQSLSYHVNLIQSTIAVAKQRGVENRPRAKWI